MSFRNFILKMFLVMKRFAIILAGGGIYDGAEMHEASSIVDNMEWYKI